MTRRFLIPALVLGALAVAGPSPLLAAQDDPRLDNLFSRLHATTDTDEAQVLQAHIWALWTRTRDDGVNTMMQSGTQAIRRGDSLGALSTFTRLVEARPQFAEAWNKRATLYYMTGRFEESIADCMKVLELEPRHFGALAGLGLIYSALGEPRRALHWFREALKQNPHLDGVRARVDKLAREIEGERI